MRIRITSGLAKSGLARKLLLLAGLGLLMISSPVSANEEYIPAIGTNPTCGLCHTCEFPTGDDQCLSKSFCLRHRGTGFENNDLPHQKVMVLDDLENVYDPVYFSHEKHAQMSEMGDGCESCHHFAPATSGHPACRNCHSTSISGSGQIEPTLKAAYHQQCLACHREWDTLTHCEWCHRKKVGGMSDEEIAKLPDLIHQAPLVVKDLIVFETEYDDGDKVPFHHKNHVELYDRDCSVCHKNEACSSCHVHGAESHPLGLISDIDLHETCYFCHDEEKGCEECHGRASSNLFDHAEVGWPLEAYHKVLQCKECHKVPGKYEANDPRCITCHFEGFDPDHFNHAVTGVILDEVHLESDCKDCHIDGFGVHTACDGCHDDHRKWERSPSFGPDVD
jgi:hypothetical protein